MTPFETDHCYHAGKGRIDSGGKRKCSPVECLTDATPAELRPELLFPKDEVTSETFFTLGPNGSFVEALIVPEVPREVVKTDYDSVCKDEEAAEMAAATVLTLPFCMSSLNHGVCYANCTQAVQTYLGRFAENGAVCRCNDGTNAKKVMRQSAMLTKLRIDAKVLLEFCSRTLNAVEYPDCLGEFDSFSCPLLGTYRGSGACYEWDYEGLVNAVHRDWGKEAQFRGRISTSDLVASAECSVLSIWYNQAQTDEHYFARYTATGNLPFSDQVNHGYKIHPSLGVIELKHSEILEAMSMDQVRDRASLMSETCYFGTMKELHPVILNATIAATAGGLEQPFLFPPAAYSTGSELHQKTRHFIEEVFPGLWGTPEPGHSYTDILDKVLKLRNMTRADLQNNLVKRDIESLIREVAFRAMMADEMPYIDDKLGDDLDALNAGALFRPGKIFELQGALWPTGYMSAKYQLRRHLQTSGVLAVDRMEEILQEVGLDGIIAVDGVGGAYDLVASGMIGPASTQTAFSTLIERVRWDECELRPLWDEVGGRQFVMEHLRLNMDVPGFIARNSSEEKARMYHLRSAHLDPSVFEDPLKFNPKRKNLHQALFFNGLEKDYDVHMNMDGYVNQSSIRQAPNLARWCPGRHLSYNLIVELAPLFFPPKTDEYHCHNGIRARSGVKFSSELIKIDTDDVELEVLKVDGKSSGKNLMILLGTIVDVPVGWAPFIANMKNKKMKQDLDYWVLVMPGWGGKGTRIERYTMDLVSTYVADLIRHAKKSYDRVFMVSFKRLCFVSALLEENFFLQFALKF